MTAVTGDYENKPFVCIPLLLLDLRPDFDMWPPCFLREGFLSKRFGSKQFLLDDYLLPTI